MKEICLVLFALYAISGCRGEEKHEIEIINRSSSAVDSVFFPYGNLKFTEKIRVNERKKFQVQTPKNQSEDQSLGLFLYKNGKKILATWRLCDMGACTVTNEQIYVFNNGINYKDENLQKPKELSVYIIDKTSGIIDSVQALTPTSIKKRFVTPKHIKLILDFDRIKNDQSLKIFQGGAVYLISIDHDWEDWNNNQEIICVYDNGITSKVEK